MITPDYNLLHSCRTCTHIFPLAMPPKKRGSRGRHSASVGPPPPTDPSHSPPLKTSSKCRNDSSDDDADTSLGFVDHFPPGIIDTAQPSAESVPSSQVCEAFSHVMINTDHRSSLMTVACKRRPLCRGWVRLPHRPHLHPQ
jgi:hypothetical protein